MFTRSAYSSPIIALLVMKIKDLVKTGIYYRGYFERNTSINSLFIGWCLATWLGEDGGCSELFCCFPLFKETRQ